MIDTSLARPGPEALEYIDPFLPTVPTFAVRETTANVPTFAVRQSLGQQMLERWAKMG